MQTFYYPRTCKGIIVALTDMFDNMVVYKYATDTTSAGYGTSSQAISIPINFGPVEKEYLQRIEDHEYVASGTDATGYKSVEAVGQRYYLYLPRMSLILNGIAYDAERAYGVNEWREWFQEVLELSGSDIDEILQDYAPAPYNYNFTLSIMTDSMDYFAQIIENILPYFNPKLYLRVKEFSFLNIERDLPVTINGVNPEFISPEIIDTERRYVNGTIDLTVEGWQYRPFEYGKIIKSIHSKYFVVDASNDYGISALSEDDEPPKIYVVSGDYFDTSGAFMNSAGGVDTSAISAMVPYSYSGTYEDNVKDLYYFTSATIIG